MKKPSALSPRAKPPVKSAASTKRSPELKAELKLRNRRDSALDLSDAPPLPDWSGAQRGRFYRPVKQPVSLRLDADVVAWFKTGGERYQSRINGVLREYMVKEAGH